jgi:copper chaperone
MAAAGGALRTQCGPKRVDDHPQGPPMIEYTIPTMTCAHCAQTITKTIQRIDAEAKVEIDLEARRVRIDTVQLGSAFGQALSDEGYAPAAAAR